VPEGQRWSRGKGRKKYISAYDNRLYWVLFYYSKWNALVQIFSKLLVLLFASFALFQYRLDFLLFCLLRFVWSIHFVTLNKILWLQKHYLKSSQCGLISSCIGSKYFNQNTEPVNHICTKRTGKCYENTRNYNIIYELTHSLSVLGQHHLQNNYSIMMLQYLQY